MCRAEEGLGTSLTPNPRGNPVTYVLSSLCEWSARAPAAAADKCLCHFGVTGCRRGWPGQQGLVPQVF